MSHEGPGLWAGLCNASRRVCHVSHGKRGLQGWSERARCSCGSVQPALQPSRRFPAVGCSAAAPMRSRAAQLAWAARASARSLHARPNCLNGVSEANAVSFGPAQASEQRRGPRPQAGAAHRGLTFWFLLGQAKRNSPAGARPGGVSLTVQPFTSTAQSRSDPHYFTSSSKTAVSNVRLDLDEFALKGRAQLFQLLKGKPRHPGIPDLQLEACESDWPAIAQLVECDLLTTAGRLNLERSEPRFKGFRHRIRPPRLRITPTGRASYAIPVAACIDECNVSCGGR